TELRPDQEKVITTKERLASAARPARTVFRKEVELAVNDAVGASQATVAAELGDLRRILTDDMDATNEATAVFGRMLARLSDRLEEVAEQLVSIEARLDALSGPSPVASSAAGSAPAGGSAAGPSAGGARGRSGASRGNAAPSKPARKPPAARNH
ncbi:MAG: hypothetical protein ACRDJU_08990, partial [Actinomycetota bacterium]